MIYCLVDPILEVVRYVGWTKSPEKRLSLHLKKVDGSPRGHWLKSLRDRGLQPRMEIIETGSGSEWKEREIWWIAYYRAAEAPLTNISAGGQGTIGLYPEEARQRISRAQIGKKRSKETCERISRSQQGLKKKVKRSEESRQRTSRANKGKKRSDEVRRQMVQRYTGRKASDATRAKMSASQRARRSAEGCVLKVPYEVA